jgi:chloramphenicol 3-O-phosphotransferase
VCTLLERGGHAYGAIEAEQLAWGSPLLPADVWLPQLAVVLKIQREAGRRLFLVAATTETAAELSGVVAATAADPVLVVALTASPETLARRLESREPDSWPGKKSLIAHAVALAPLIPALDGVDVVIDTEARSPADLAEEIFHLIGR